jgi:hypothetical protein
VCEVIRTCFSTPLSSTVRCGPWLQIKSCSIPFVSLPLSSDPRHSHQSILSVFFLFSLFLPFCQSVFLHLLELQTVKWELKRIYNFGDKNHNCPSISLRICVLVFHYLWSRSTYVQNKICRFAHTVLFLKPYLIIVSHRWFENCFIYVSPMHQNQ